jgi:succinyl-CoA synthetase beta subunit/citryl-CoA synthetase large subunit
VRFYEFEAKAFLARQGIAIPQGRLAHTAGEAAEAASTVGFPAVLKSQVLSGGRMKAGAIRFAESAAEARDAAEAILGLEVRGRQPVGVLVEPRAAVVQEYYLGVTYDTLAKLPVAIISDRGGIDIEEVAEKEPEHISRRNFSSLLPLTEFPFKDCVTSLGISGGELTTLTGVLFRLARAFLEHDLTLAEINPLARLEDGAYVALDCHIELEDEAVGRQKALLEVLGADPGGRAARPPTPLELRAAEVDSSDHRGVAGRLVEFDGSLGLIIGGGGASLTAFDAVRRHGGKPADYCEIGGNPSVSKVAELTKLILSKPGVERVAVIMNVVNNTRVDLVARGVVKGCVESGRDPSTTIAAFRIPGAWEEEGFRLLRHYGVQYFDRTVSIDEAARRAIGSMSTER